MEEFIEDIERKLMPVFKDIEENALKNQKKVLQAFKECKIALHHLAGSSGYGYDDTGKVKLNELFAKIFNAEAAICTPFLTCGTHSLCSALFGVLRPGDKFLSITGDVYDSLQTAVKGSGVGSLKEFGVDYECTDLINNDFDYKKIKELISKTTYKLIYIQRSAGYSCRETLSIESIQKVIEFIKTNLPHTIIFVDNCYGTFSAPKEPTDVGADICVGSLIKNAGGGICPTGGYVVGKQKYIDLIAGRIFGIGLGTEVGSYAYGYQNYFEGIFIAPSVVKNALKGSALLGAVLKEFNIESVPKSYTVPKDLIRQINFNDENKMIEFIRKVQENSPVDSFVVPYPSEMPGYADPVIMAAGAFVQGASIEMSADGPVRPPYTVYFQGGITYEQVKLFVTEVAKMFK